MESPTDHSGLLDVTHQGPRSIPKVKFLEDVESFLHDRKLDDVIIQLQELHSKYQYMERSLTSHQRSLSNKLTDIHDALQSVQLLTKKKDATTSMDIQFVLSDNLYAKAEVEPSDTVYLWLGANTLLEYPLEEAQTLLVKNESNAKSSIEDVQQCLHYLRRQITTTEVNIARVHNYGVTLRKKNNPSIHV